MAEQLKFLNSYILDGRGGGHAIDASDVANWTEDQGVLWVHLDITDPASRQWVMHQSGVDDAAAEILLAEDVRPRTFMNEHGLIVVLRGVNMNPGQDPEDMVSIRVWVEHNRIITSRRRPLLSAQDVRASIDKGDGPTSPGTFLGDLLERMANRIDDFVENIETRMGEAEDNLAENRSPQFRQRLGALRRQIAAVRRFIAPQRDALDRLYRQPGQWLSQDEAEHVREEADRITRYLEDLDLARERAIVLQEEFLNQMAQEQNARMYLLSVVAAIFLPLTFVTGLLGMNVGGLPGVESGSGFWYAMITMIVAAIGLVVLFRWKKWI